VIGMTGLPLILSVWCFDGLLGNIDVREDFLCCCNLVELVCWEEKKKKLVGDLDSVLIQAKDGG
jgi:hypothetical protein